MIPFEELIRELGNLLGLSLKPDHHEACLLHFAGGIKIQIDLGPNADTIILGSELGRVQAGPYRGLLLKEALRANGLLTIPKGVLAYSEKKNELILFQELPLKSTQAAHLLLALNRFMKQVELWKKAIEKEEIPHLEPEQIKQDAPLQ